MRNAKRFPYLRFSIAIFFFAIYAVLPTRMYYSDGLDFAYFLERPDFGPEGLHPHHPLFLPLAWIFYSLVKFIFPALTALRFLTLVSALSGAIGIWLFMRLLRLWGDSEHASVLGGFFLGSAFAYWHYSSDADAYMTALAIGLWGLVVFFSRTGSMSSRRACIAGIIFGAAVLTHEIAIFIIVGFLYYLFLERKKIGFKFSSALFFSFIGVLLIGFIVSFFVLARMSGSGLGEYYVYITSHTRARYFWTIINKPIVQVGTDVARSHANLFFHLRPQELYFYDRLKGDTPTSLIFYRSFLALGLLIAFTALICIQPVEQKRRSIIRMNFVWLALVFAFTFAFMPENHFYRIFYLPPMIFICGQFLRTIAPGGKTIVKVLLAGALVAYFVFNMMKGIIPDRAIRNNPFINDTARIDRFVGRNDLVIFPAEERYRTKFYRYFGKGNALRVTSRIAYMDYWTDIWPNREKFADETRDYLKSNYKSLIISETAWKQGEEYLLLARYNLPGPMSRLMMIEKEQLVVEEKILGPNEWFYKAYFE